MTCQISRRIALNAVALIVAAGYPHSAAGQESGFADPVLGRWNITVSGPDGHYPSWLEIRLRTERQLMAGFVGRFGSMRHASSVNYVDGRLEVHIPVQYETDSGVLIFSGMLENGQLAGQLTIDDSESVHWTAVRAPALNRTTVDEWGNPVSLLSDGLAGWVTRSAQHPGCWHVSGGVLSATPPCVDLISREKFADFKLELEFRYPPGSNSGVYLRGRYEVQIQDDRGKVLDPLRLGGIYGFIAPAIDAAGRPGEWQSMAVELIGRRVSVVLNGERIIENREMPGITGGALDSKEGEAGPLMLQGDHGPIEYRNIIVTPAS